MDEALSEKIDQIAKMFGKDKVPDNIKEVIASMASNSIQKNENDNYKEEVIEDDTQDYDKNAVYDDLPDNINLKNNESRQLVRKVENILGKLENKPDHRIDLINSIKPFLKDSRQKKCDTCVKILKFTAIAKISDLLK